MAVTQEGFRWRNDDGNETTATWKAAQDTNASIAVGEKARLRVILDATGDPDPAAFTLYYRKLVPSYAEEVLADSPAGVWMLDETAGTNANDSTANNRDGTYTGTYALNSGTILGLPAADFGGGYVNIADNDAFSPQAGASGIISVECLYKPDAVSGRRFIVAKGSGDAGGQYEWACTAEGPQVGMHVWTSLTASGEIYFDTVNTFTVGGEYHLVWVYDRAANVAKIYINGVESTPLWSSPTWSGTPAAGTAPLQIGQRAAGDGQVDGKVAGVSIYPTVLSAARVAAHYAALTAAEPTWLPVPVGIGSTFAPTDITGCHLWLDADDATQFTFSSGVVVSQWADKSASANHFAWIQGTPTRETAVVSGKAVVRFPPFAILQSVTTAQPGSGFTSGELFVVIKLANDNGSEAPGLHTQWDTSGQQSHFPYSDGNIYEAWGTTSRKNIGNPTPILAAWRLYNVRTASGAWSAHLDGTQLFTTASNTVGFATTGAPRITAGGDESADIAEMIVYNNVIGSGDRANLHAYIATKYGLTIA